MPRVSRAARLGISTRPIHASCAHFAALRASTILTLASLNVTLALAVLSLIHITCLASVRKFVETVRRAIIAAITHLELTMMGVMTTAR